MSSGGRTELPCAMWFRARAEGSPLIVSSFGGQFLRRMK
jgi:hypothetical protein